MRNAASRTRRSSQISERAHIPAGFKAFSACLVLVFVIFSFAPFSKSATWSFNVPPCLEVLSLPTVSLPFFSLFQTLHPVVRCLLEVEKFLSSRKFLPSSLFNWQDEYRWDKAWRGTAFDKTSEGPGARPVSSFCSFPITGFLAWMLKDTVSNANCESQPFMEHQ